MSVNLKKVMFQFTPRIILDLFRCIVRCGYDNMFHIWDGVYDHFREINLTPGACSYYGSDDHVKNIELDLMSRMSVAKNSKTIPMEVVGEHVLLPLLASIIYEEQGRLNVFDFGGGAGLAYFHLLRSIPDCSNIAYHIVELDKVCEVGTQLFVSDKRIHFHSTLPHQLSEVDILYLNSSLQYVEDYIGLLNSLCDYKPKYFFFVKLSAGDIPTYATLQKNLPRTPVPYWFINVDELIEIMSNKGYSLLYKSALNREYNQNNFREEYRMGKACNLLFSLTNPGNIS